MIDLLKHSSQADRSLIAALYQRHAPSILTFIRRHIPSREDAEDALLEVFLAALESEKLDALNEGEQLAWLRRSSPKKKLYLSLPHHRSCIPLVEPAMETIFNYRQHERDITSLRRHAH